MILRNYGYQFLGVAKAFQLIIFKALSFRDIH